MTQTAISPVPFLPFPGGALCPRFCDDDVLQRSWTAINNPRNRMFLMSNLPKTLEEQRTWLIKPDDAANITQFIQFDGRIVGSMGAHRIDMVHGTATTGTVIWDPADQGKGIATLAKHALLQYLFDTRNLRLVYSHVIDFNARSARYSDKCGYREVARLQNRFRFGQQYADELILEVTRETWYPKFLEVLQKQPQDNPGYHVAEHYLKTITKAHRQKKH